MKNKNRKGFTLAELLIVVAIIAVLVAISIPIFSKQLEKSRDAASIANIRSAYAQAVNYAIEYDGYSKRYPEYAGQDIGNGYKIWVNSTGYVSAVQIPVTILSHQANDWSGLADKLPFKLKGPNGSTNLNGDSGKYTTSYRKIYVIFHFNSLGVGEVQDAQLTK